MKDAIEWFAQRRGKVSYSMINRNGPASYDCSSAVYYALIAAGKLPQGHRIGNTETLFVDLPKYGFQRLEEDANGYIPTQRGDIFIWGEQGRTAGAGGHTGIYIDNDNIIHCAYGYNGIHIDNHDWLAGINNIPRLTIFRYVPPAPQPTPAPAPKIEPKVEVQPEILAEERNEPKVEEKPVENHIADVSKMVENEEIKPVPINERKFTDKEVKMIEEFQKKALEDVANTEYEPRISEKAKTTVYFVADLGILVNMLIATICVILIPNATKEILAISGAVATALAGLKPIFKLGAKK